MRLLATATARLLACLCLPKPSHRAALRRRPDALAAWLLADTATPTPALVARLEARCRADANDRLLAPDCCLRNL